MGLPPVEYAASLKCALFPRARLTLTGLTGVHRHTKEHTGRSYAPDWVRSSRRGTPVSSPSRRRSDGPHMSPSKLPPPCVSRDERTQELTEYCSLDHMRFVGPVWHGPSGCVLFFFFFWLSVLNVAPSGSPQRCCTAVWLPRVPCV